MHRQQFTLKYITGFRPNELYLSPGLISLHSDFVSNNTQMLLQARAPPQLSGPGTIYLLDPTLIGPAYDQQVKCSTASVHAGLQLSGSDAGRHNEMNLYEFASRK